MIFHKSEVIYRKENSKFSENSAGHIGDKQIGGTNLIVNKLTNRC